CNCSRMTHSSGVSLAASTDIFRPLILRLGISLPFRCMKPLTAATHCWVSAATHRVSDSCHDNDPDTGRRQSNLELLKGNKFPKIPVVRCGNAEAFETPAPMS